MATFCENLIFINKLIYTKTYEIIAREKVYTLKKRGKRIREKWKKEWRVYTFWEKKETVYTFSERKMKVFILSFEKEQNSLF